MRGNIKKAPKVCLIYYKNYNKNISKCQEFGYFSLKLIYKTYDL